MTYTNGVTYEYLQ